MHSPNSAFISVSKRLLSEGKEHLLTGIRVHRDWNCSINMKNIPKSPNWIEEAKYLMLSFMFHTRHLFQISDMLIFNLSIQISFREVILLANNCQASYFSWWISGREASLFLSKLWDLRCYFRHLFGFIRACFIGSVLGIGVSCWFDVIFVLWFRINWVAVIFTIITFRNVGIVFYLLESQSYKV